jgi:energy-coupling factor transport system permease protein
MTATSELDSRAWLAWGLAAMLPLLLGRNPWLTAEVLIIVLVVRGTWLDRQAEQSNAWFVRIALVMAAISVVFNVLTVHAGDRAFASLPNSWPVIGGDLTWNAVAYGLVSGLTLFGLVLTGITVAAMIRWVDLFHLLPPRLAPIAVTGSVAWAFLPQTAIAWTNIREAMTMRGHRFKGARDFVPILVPLLASGLERSLAMAEALEARGFGLPVEGQSGRTQKQKGESFHILLLVAGLVGMAFAAYCLATRQADIGLVAGIMSAGALLLLSKVAPARGPRTTRYRELALQRADWMTIGTALTAIAAVIGWAATRPESLRFDTYPTIEIPAVEPLLMAVLALLLLPAFLRTPESTVS